MKKYFKYAPLSSSMTLISLIGMLVTGLGIFPYADAYPALLSWGFTFFMFFLILFLASMVSVAQSEPLPHHMESLAVHEDRVEDDEE